MATIERAEAINGRYSLVGTIAYAYLGASELGNSAYVNTADYDNNLMTVEGIIEKQTNRTAGGGKYNFLKIIFHKKCKKRMRLIWSAVTPTGSGNINVCVVQKNGETIFIGTTEDKIKHSLLEIDVNAGDAITITNNAQYKLAICNIII